MDGVEEAAQQKARTGRRTSAATPADPRAERDPNLWGELEDPGAPPRWRQACPPCRAKTCCLEHHTRHQQLTSLLCTGAQANTDTLRSSTAAVAARCSRSQGTPGHCPAACSCRRDRHDRGPALSNAERVGRKVRFPSSSPAVKADRKQHLPVSLLAPCSFAAAAQTPFLWPASEQALLLAGIARSPTPAHRLPHLQGAPSQCGITLSCHHLHLRPGERASSGAASHRPEPLAEDCGRWTA